ncbi:CdaR family protein [Desulfoscipio sp. XC116]|uniref:CdaR family protein n=1 Tax=Desulfoscipio sp. XC116 TaxID=3144975 RepID=UPI00325B92CA
MAFRWRDNSIRILAVFMALVLWVYVTNEQNPVINRTYHIPLTVQGKPTGYVTSGVPEKIYIKVQSPKSIGATLGAGDFTARVSLLGITEGERELPVQVTAPPGVEVLQVTPQAVRVLADRITEKNVPVALNLKGKVSHGLQKGEPVLKPPVVTLHGPSKLLAEINRIGVTVDVSGAADTLVRDVAVQTGVKGVTVSPGRVSVTVPVASLPAGELPVRVKLTGEPAEGYAAGDPLVQPAFVQVTGPQQVLDSLISVNTMAVDISGAAENVEKEVVLMLPDGAVSVRPDRVHVTVRIAPVETEQPPPPVEEENPESENG